MEENKIAFITKKLDLINNKIIALTMDSGKRCLYFKKPRNGTRLHPGMLISFTKIERNQAWTAENIEILINPTIQEHQDLYSIHHILELCNYFIPFNKPCPEIFTFLRKFITFNQCITQKCPSLDKIFVVKLLSLFGFYSHNKISGCLELYDKLTLSFIDFSHDQKLEFLKCHLSGLQEKDLDYWIMQSLKEHPYFNSFKTLNFFYEKFN
jgi:hypothetical protein